MPKCDFNKVRTPFPKNISGRLLLYNVIWNIEENDKTNILLTHFTPLVPFYTP